MPGSTPHPSDVVKRWQRGGRRRSGPNVGRFALQPNRARRPRPARRGGFHLRSFASHPTGSGRFPGQLLTDGAQNTLFPFLRLSADVRFSSATRRCCSTNRSSWPPHRRCGATWSSTARRFGLARRSTSSTTSRSGCPRTSTTSSGRNRAKSWPSACRCRFATPASPSGRAMAPSFGATKTSGRCGAQGARALHLREQTLAGLGGGRLLRGSPGFNGSDNQFVGAILDGSLRVGVELTQLIDAFLNVCTILGGAVGTARRPTPPSDGYTNNWL